MQESRSQQTPSHADQGPKAAFGETQHPPAAASRGLPSYLWRAGQDRRLEMIRRHLPLQGARALDLGCGLGMYTARLVESGAQATGLEIDWARALEARERGLDVIAAVGEALPFASDSIDAILSHEVLEHVADDHASAREIARVLAPGGRAIVFVPNRWWPFETHGIFWRGNYRFGNIPGLNYLPDPLRNHLAPHVRVYTARGLRAHFEGQQLRIVHHGRVFPGYDKLAAKRPVLGGFLRRLSYALEEGPFSIFGLSHVLVVEKGDGFEQGSESEAGRIGA